MIANNSSSIRNSLVYFGAVALLAVSAASAQVATGTTGIDASGSFQQEMNACMTGKTQQDKDTCMREARNAQADKKRGVLENASGNAQLKANATERCNALSGEDKAACELRINGYGSTSGSVAGGGVVRQVETAVVPEGAGAVTINAQTPNTVILVPAN